MGHTQQTGTGRRISGWAVEEVIIWKSSYRNILSYSDRQNRDFIYIWQEDYDVDPDDYVKEEDSKRPKIPFKEADLAVKERVLPPAMKN